MAAQQARPALNSDLTLASSSSISSIGWEVPRGRLQRARLFDSGYYLARRESGQISGGSEFESQSYSSRAVALEGVSMTIVVSRQLEKLVTSNAAKVRKIFTRPSM
jgi:hypothetical protein